MGMAATGSARLGSSLLAALTISAAFGGPLLGAVLDRARYPGRILTLALWLYAGGLAFIGLLLGQVTTWLIVVIALASGLFMPSISGGWSSRLKSFVADEHLARASAVDAATYNMAGLAGPALAGLIAAWLGAGWAIAAVVALVICALPMAWSLPGRREPATRTSLARDVAAGFAIILANRALFRIASVSVVSCVGMGALWVISPLLGQALFGNAGYGGLLLSSLAMGALAATTLYARWPPRHGPDRVIFTATLLLVASLLALAFAHTRTGALVAMFVAGIADGPQLAATFEVRHREAPERLRSQVFTTAASLKIAAFAIGAAVAGQLSAVSLRVTILAACGAQVLAALTYLAVKVEDR